MTYNANDTMLRWSDQLLVAAENDHFEGSTRLKVNPGRRSDWASEVGAGESFSHSTLLRLETCATFKVVVLRR